MKKIILIGIPGCGKSTLGRRAAHVMQVPFYDTDKLSMERIKLERLSDIFRLTFSGQFIRAQIDVMNELAQRDEAAMISTGAETALIPECAALMKKMGTVVHIQRKPELAAADMKIKRKDGIVLSVKGKDVDMREDGMKFYMEEYSKYEALADLKLDNNGTEDRGFKKLIKMLT